VSAATEELARLVAYVFHAVGRRRISEDDWVRVLSLERKWVPPSRARRLAQRAREAGALRNAGERDYEMGLLAEGRELAIDYRPDTDLLERTPVLDPSIPPPPPEAELPLFRRIARHVASTLGQSETDVIGRINATQQALGGILTAEVAALYWGALQGIDVSHFYDEAESTLRG
jgi:hypothetical protein